MGKVTVSRQGLYDRLWAEPMRTVCNGFGIDYKTIKAICARHDIPLPPQGYWSKLAFGKLVAITPLPLRDDLPDIIEISAAVTTKKPKQSLLKAKQSKPRHLSKSKNAEIERLIAITVNYQNEARPDRVPEINPIPLCRQGLSLFVSHKNLRRAVAIYRDILLTADSLGMKVSIDDCRTLITVNTHRIEVALQEHRRREKTTSDPLCSYKLKFTGYLKFIVRGRHSIYDREARDCPDKPLEQQIDRIIDLLTKESVRRQEFENLIAESRRQQDLRKQAEQERRHEHDMLMSDARRAINHLRLLPLIDRLTLNIDRLPLPPERTREIISQLQSGNTDGCQILTGADINTLIDLFYK
ncbi:MAG: hypothetical protein Q4C34_02620 [Bacteroidales bacterium]|nr:hypothetical protein [Bacteroidales bacterium]